MKNLVASQVRGEKTDSWSSLEAGSFDRLVASNGIPRWTRWTGGVVLTAALVFGPAIDSASAAQRTYSKSIKSKSSLGSATLTQKWVSDGKSVQRPLPAPTVDVRLNRAVGWFVRYKGITITSEVPFKVRGRENGGVARTYQLRYEQCMVFTVGCRDITTKPNTIRMQYDGKSRVVGSR